MSYSLTMAANPAAGSFCDFLRARYGSKWVLAPRMTDRLRRSGHERSITQKQYVEAEREWETLAYGAPLKSLEAAAPAMLAALKLACQHVDSQAMSYSEGDHGERIHTRDVMIAAIAAAEGRR